MKELAKTEWDGTKDGALPGLAFVPASLRRRLTPLEKAAIAVADETLMKAEGLFDPSNVKVVFASRWGEIGTTLKLICQMHEEGEMSPAGFSNSVHNASPGYFSLIKGLKTPYTAIAAGEDTLEAGLVEAKCQEGIVLFVYAEEATPEMYVEHFEDVQHPHALAILMDNDA